MHQDAIISLLARETDCENIKFAIESLVPDSSNISLLCGISSKLYNEKAVISVLGDHLTKILNLEELTNSQKLRVYCHLFNIKDFEVEFDFEKLTNADFQEILAILGLAKNLERSMEFFVKRIANVENIARREELVSMVLKDSKNTCYVPHLFDVEIPLELTDKMAFLSFADPNLMKKFIQVHLTKNLRMEENPKLTVGRYFARLAFRHDFCIRPVLALIQSIDCITSHCPVIELLALVGMTSNKSATRKAAMKIFATLCDFTKKLDPISKKILKKSLEIETDSMLLQQILSKALAKEGPEKEGLEYKSKYNSNYFFHNLRVINKNSSLCEKI